MSEEVASSFLLKFFDVKKQTDLYPTSNTFTKITRAYTYYIILF